MKSATEFKPTLNFGLLLQGQPKSRKTTTALEFSRPYVADCDNNLSGPLRWFKENKPAKLAEIKYDTVNFYDDGKVVPEHERYKRLISLLAVAAAEPTIDTIIVDSLSSVSDYLIDHIVYLKPDGKEKFMTISDWSPFRNLISKLVVSLRNTKKLFIMTSHEETVKDDLTGAITIRTNMPSKLADNIGGFFSDVWRTEAEEVGGVMKFTVRAMPTGRLPGLGSSLGLPKEFVFDGDAFRTKYLEKYGK